MRRRLLSAEYGRLGRRERLAKAVEGLRAGSHARIWADRFHVFLVHIDNIT
jgi:hypothetical protein